ncbi:hypothetical protein CPB83DRAFT_775024 [Crepidotus variabilis]|uniref:Uncharacterized protein n=1 Tax=Crepidotus variabilis TaxID=179855 RepID=A0A9P6JK66_9AGAR|nr:hypothetical protein CPB83DRAFT_775024 [Crepidotus variabilis]
MDGSNAFARTLTRRPYKGSRRKIVLAMDIGTTFSGVSYSILDPGQQPIVKAVTRFPAQTHIGDAKIPSIAYYDQSGAIQAIGAEALEENILESAAENEWYKAEWFKLHLRDANNDSQSSSFDFNSDIPALPPNRTVIDIFADFLRYLHSCTKEYIKESHPNGEEIWDNANITNDIDYVLSHPNGWEGKEQTEMRKAAVEADLIPDTNDGHKRLSFVTEGEASLHFAVECGVLAENTEGVIIVDAGGGTVDISTYGKKMEGGRNIFSESATPECHFHGSVFVTMAAGKMMEEYLKDSPYVDDIEHIMQCFDRTTKLQFKSIESAQYVKFGSNRDMDVKYNIRFGQLKLEGWMIATCFEPSIDCIVKVVKEHQRTATTRISHVVLVGGFAASNWLFDQVKAMLSSTGLKVLRPENRTNKAVSDGAISYYLDHHVRARMARYSYGDFICVLYDETDDGHLDRSTRLVTWQDGTKRIPDYFDVMIKKGTSVSETQEFPINFYRIFKKGDHVNRTLNSTIWCYKGNHEDPQWRDIDPGGFVRLCTLQANLSDLPMKRKWTLRGSFYRVEYSVIIHFGLTEMKAQLQWLKSGRLYRTPAKIVYDP